MSHSIDEQSFVRYKILISEDFKIWGDDRCDRKCQRLITAATKLIGMVLCNGVVGNLKALFSEDRQERIP